MLAQNLEQQKVIFQWVHQEAANLTRTWSRWGCPASDPELHNGSN